MNRTAVFAVLIVSGVALALALRLPQLNLRPMHGDEAVHACKFNELWTTGRYVYNPDEYHGPTLYYLTFPSVWLSGAKDFAQTEAATYRIVPVFFGVGLILLLLLIADGLGRPAVVWAGVLTAVSPAMVFYSRYYIQETLLVFFAFLVIAAGWRYVRTRRIAWALVAGVGLGLMHATKETCLVALGSMVTALVLAVVWNRTVDSRCASERQRLGKARATPLPLREGAGGGSEHRSPDPHPTLPLGGGGSAKAAPIVGTLTGALLIAIVVSSLLFSGFLTNFAGPLDSCRAYVTYFSRAASGAHIHPWYYYLSVLTWTQYGRGPVWTEALIVALSVVGFVAALRRTPPGGTIARFARFVAFYTLVMAVVYSALPYKTPWCALGFLHGMILLAGVGAATLVRLLRYRNAQVVITVLLISGAAHLGWQAWRSNTKFYADPRNPYVYAHPVTDVADLATYLEQLADVHSSQHGMVIKIMAENCWPLPWYLRRFEHVGYWETIPEQPDADVVLVTRELQAPLVQSLHNRYEVSYYGLRRDAVLAVYVSQDLRDAFVLRAQRGKAGESGSGPTPP